jgi:xylan 1,4-beta-xylosidase
LTEYRIDQENSNSYEVWKKMGSPQKPTDEQIAELEKAGQLKAIRKQSNLKLTNKTFLMSKLPRQAVSLIKLDW